MEEKSNNQDEIHNRIVNLENDLKAQEHRISVIVRNIIDYGFDNSDEKKRNAVWISLIGYLLSRQTAAIIVGGLSTVAACVGIWIAWQANELVSKQNILIERQNIRLDQQTYLQEADRRSSLVFLMGNVLESIDKELKDDAGKKQVRDLTPELIGRIVALTHILRPYKFMDGDILTTNELSPEKGQVLISLLDSKIDTSSLFSIFKKADFSYSFLRGVTFEDISIKNIVLNASDFRGASFFNCEIAKSQILGSDFSETYFRDCKFSEVVLWQSTLYKAQMISCELQKSPFVGSKFIDAYFDKCKFISCNFERCNIYGTSFSETELIKVSMHKDTILKSYSDNIILQEVTISNKTFIDDISYPSQYDLIEHEIYGQDTTYMFIPKKSIK